MPFASVEKVTVSAGDLLRLPDGTWQQGKLTFTGPDLVTIGAQDVLLGGGTTVDLVDGNFSVQLVATDATGMSPTGWTYKVTAKLTNAPDWVRYITLPKAAASVKLAAVIVPNPVAGTFTVLVDPSTIGGTTPASTVATETAFGQASAVGTATPYARGDHTHGTPAMPRLDQAGAPTAAVGLNGQKVTSLANGTAVQDAAAFGQIPVAGTAAANFAAGNDSRITGAAQKSANLSDLASAPTARTNLGLGGAAILNVGAVASTVAAGDDTRLADARTPLAHKASHSTGGGDALIPSDIGATKPADIQVFLASGTWTKPTGAKTVLVHLLAGGAGGGSGRRGAAATVRCGGGGGGGGAVYQGTLQASVLGATVAVTVGTGGAGGASRTTDDTDGAAGTTGGPSLFGTFARTGTTSAGGGGTATAGTGGSSGTGTTVGGTGGAASATGGAGASGNPGVLPAASGGAGGGITAANAASAGGAGGSNPGASAGTGGVVDSTAPTNPGDAATSSGIAGGGGGGGAGSITTAAQSGAAGALYGAGGGGGGASLNLAASGAGGAGANGIAVIVTYF